jgi:hypothetical protein
LYSSFVLVVVLGFIKTLGEKSCRKKDFSVHEETLSEDKEGERCLGGPWSSGSYVMLGFSLVMLGFVLHM